MLFHSKLIASLCIIQVLISITRSSPTVGRSPMSEDKSFLFGGLDNFKDDIHRNDWSSHSFSMSPEESMLSDLMENSKERYYATILLYYILPKEGNTVQNKIKKNSEMSRGMYNALNHMDMFNAGR